jgi:drug/metabolite transporter (DMT)-like permease
MSAAENASGRGRPDPAPSLLTDRAGAARATLVGSVAVLLWASLALLGVAAGPVPPFQTVAICFAIAFLLALGKWLWFGESVGAHLRQPASVWALGVSGLFGYHFLYFLALKHAPAVDVSLINYLWPLLIVLLSVLLPGEQGLRWWHVAGAVLGLVGTALLVTDGGRVAFRAEYTGGYAAALACAFAWSGYSVLSRRMRTVPTDAVGAFCGTTALLALFCHLLFERWVRPTGGEALALLALGLGPVGLAFYVWDYGVKHGNIRALGGLSYATPLLSTLLLILAGRAAPTLTIGLSCLLIVGGAVLASRELWDRSG